MNLKFIKSEYNNQKYLGAMLDDKMVGFLRYKISKRDAWLYFIGVNKEYRNHKDLHIGTKLMKIFENDCANKFVYFIEGKFYPKGESGDVVRKFYDKNGYKIEREDYELLINKFNPKKTELGFQVEDVDFETFDKYLQEYLQEDENERD